MGGKASAYALSSSLRTDTGVMVSLYGLVSGLGCLQAFLSAGRPVRPWSGAWWLRDAWGVPESGGRRERILNSALCAGSSRALVVVWLAPRASLGHWPRLSLRFPRGGAPSGRVCRCVLRRASGVSSSSLAPSFGVPGFPPVLLSPFLLAGPLCRLFPGATPRRARGLSYPTWSGCHSRSGR